MDYQDDYDKLDNLIRGIDVIVDDLTGESFRDYIDRLNEIKYEAQNELEERGEKLQKEHDKEEREREKEYWEAVI